MHGGGHDSVYNPSVPNPLARVSMAASRAWKHVFCTPQGVLVGAAFSAAVAAALYFAFQRHTSGAEKYLIQSLLVLLGAFLLYGVLVVAWQYLRIPYHMARKELQLTRVDVGSAAGWEFEVSMNGRGGIRLRMGSPNRDEHQDGTMDEEWGHRSDLMCHIANKRAERFEMFAPAVAESGWGNPMRRWPRCDYPDDFPSAKAESGTYVVDWYQIPDEPSRVGWGSFTVKLRPIPDTGERPHE